MDSHKNGVAMSVEPVADFQIAGFGETSVDFYDIQGSSKPNRIHNVIDGCIGKSTLVVQCDVESIVHGTMKGDFGEVPASLIVYKFAFAPLSRERRFISANIQLEFVGSGDNFMVSRIAPDVEYQASPSTKTVVVDNTGNVSLTVPVATSPGFGYTFHESTSAPQTSYIDIQSTLRSFGNVNTDGVVWTMQENPQTKKGIPSVLQTAVLVQRDPKDTTGGKFKAKLKIHCDVHATIEDRLKIHGIAGRTDQDKKTDDEAKANDYTMTLNYDASLESYNPWNIDAKHLDAVALADYQGLVTVPTWVDGKDSHLGEPTAPSPPAGAKSPAAGLAA